MTRTLRLSQTVSPFGVGAVLDILGESLMGVDISMWPEGKTDRVTSPRLERSLGVNELRSPPSVASRASEKTPGIYYQRFPRWLFCQDCRRMHRSRNVDENGSAPRCKHCTATLVPMRFITVCASKGHAIDVPWDRWAHSRARTDDQRACRDPALTLNSTPGGTEGLSSLVVSCLTCDARRDLGELTDREALHRIGVRCPGRQPWQTGTDTSCPDRLEVLQRGATNVTWPDITTALDIPEPTTPPRDLAADIRQHRYYEDVASAPDGPEAPALIRLMAKHLDLDEADVRRAIRSAPGTDDALREARAGLLVGEWHAFLQSVAHPDEPTGTPDFVVSATSLTTDTDGPATNALGDVVAEVVLVHRLREVRVLNGFRRYTPDADLVNVNLGLRGGQPWLPAVESFGEGIFVTLDERRLAAWESHDAVVARAATLERRRRTSRIGSRMFEASPRAVLLHSLAHLLMRRLAFTCGYSAASLRERVYSVDGDDSQAGLLIYTAAGDAEGTLGGLVRQGEAPRLARTLLAALEEADWCSADPLCRESRGQGLDTLNLAACHGCSLIAETSCERNNVLLDRVLVVGDHDTPGYFAPVLQQLRT